MKTDWGPLWILNELNSAHFLWVSIYLGFHLLNNLAYINNHHCSIYLVKAVYCGVPNKPIICLFDFDQNFLPSSWLSSTVFFFLQVTLTLSIFEIKRLTVFSSPRLLHPICSGLEQNFYWFKRNFPTDIFIWKNKHKDFLFKRKKLQIYGSYYFILYLY